MVTSCAHVVIGLVGAACFFSSAGCSPLKRTKNQQQATRSAPDGASLLTDFELLVKGAQIQGIHNEPDLVQAFKEQMVSRYLEREIDGPLAPDQIPISALRDYYQQHLGDFQRTRAIHAFAARIADVAGAKRLIRDLRKLSPTDTQGALTRIEQEHPSGASGRTFGDLGFVDRSSSLPTPVREAILADVGVGVARSPIRAGDHYYVIWRGNERPEGLAPIEQVDATLRHRVRKELREARHQALLQRLRKEVLGPAGSEQHSDLGSGERASR